MSPRDTSAHGVDVAPAASARQPAPAKPVIADILRTRHCVPGSVFLVEGIDSTITATSRYRAVRLLLGDGELCLQALLNGDIHGLVDSGTVYVGCYVRVDKFELRFFGHGSGPRRDAEKDGLAYLIAADLAVVGLNPAYVDMSSVHGPETMVEAEMPLAIEMEESEKPGDRQEPLEEMALNHIDAEHISDPEDGFEVMHVSPTRATQRRAAASQPRQRQAPPALRTRRLRLLPWTSDDPTKPLKLTPLRSIPNLPYKQNWTVNILAVVASLSELEPSNLAPYIQRTARLADPSTGKQVLLTVFLNPREFAPRIGSVVLLLGVKNHRFDGGSLKKYESDQPKKGARWWFEDPLDLRWCDVASLRMWWDGRDPG